MRRGVVGFVGVGIQRDPERDPFGAFVAERPAGRRRTW
ncbi:Uncharacterised protein [Bordetella pertussis]|nr:Uncharacterised protein [Bordetella pertussis]